MKKNVIEISLFFFLPHNSYKTFFSFQAYSEKKCQRKKLELRVYITQLLAITRKEV